MKNLVLVEGLRLEAAAGKLTGTELIEKFTSLPDTKSNAIVLIALHYALEKTIADRKKFLLERTAKTGAYTDPDTGLTVVTTEAIRTTITSTEIERLNKLVADEMDGMKAILKLMEAGKRVKKPAGMKVTKTTYNKWSLTK